MTVDWLCLWKVWLARLVASLPHFVQEGHQDTEVCISHVMMRYKSCDDEVQVMWYWHCLLLSSLTLWCAGGTESGDIHDCFRGYLQPGGPLWHIPRQTTQLFTQHPQLVRWLPEHAGRGLRCLRPLADWDLHGGEDKEAHRSDCYGCLSAHLCQDVSR